MPRLTDRQWQNIRARWENGETYASLAKTYGVSIGTVQKHRANEGWERNPEPETGNSLEEIVASWDGGTVDIPVDADVPAEPNARIAELEAQLAAANERAARSATEVHIPILDTREKVLEHIGIAALRQEAQTRLNTQRRDSGFPPLEYADDDARLVAEVDRVIEERLLALDRYVTNTAFLRVMKIAWKDDRQPTGYRLGEIGVEDQFLNEIMEPGKVVRHYRGKGALLPLPFRCMRSNCWKAAATKPNGEFEFDGYCREAHAHLEGPPGAGVTTTRTAATITG